MVRYRINVSISIREMVRFRVRIRVRLGPLLGLGFELGLHLLMLSFVHSRYLHLDIAIPRYSRRELQLRTTLGHFDKCCKHVPKW